MEPNQKAKKSKKEKETIEQSLLDLSALTVMDEKIWKELPEDLLEGVIARLPIVAFFQYSLVCQGWVTLLESHSFLQRCQEVTRQTKPWFYYKPCTYTNGKADIGAMYDTYTEKWHRYPTCTEFVHPLASTGGLVYSVDYQNQCYMVGNPVTQVWNKFSGTPGSLRGDGVALVMYKGGYKIVATSLSGKFEVYDSLVNNSTSSPSPTTKGRIPNRNTPKAIPIKTGVKRWMDRNDCTSPVTIDTVVYYLSHPNDGILSYDVVSGVWNQFLIPDPQDSTDLSLATCEGRIFLVGLVRDQIVAPFSVCVWELQKTMLAWKEVDRMPKSWCSDLSTLKEEVVLKCMGSTRMIMMALQAVRINQLFTYDLATREWSKVPHFAAPSGRKLCHRADCGVVFFPSLYAAP